MITIKLVGLINGPATEFDGQYLVEYDPHPLPDGHNPNGEFCHLMTTADPAKAARFETLREALEVYRATSGRVRWDGRMDCPLTAFSAEFENWPADAQWAEAAGAFDEAAAACHRLADAIDKYGGVG